MEQFGASGRVIHVLKRSALPIGGVLPGPGNAQGRSVYVSSSGGFTFTHVVSRKSLGTGKYKDLECES